MELVEEREEIDLKWYGYLIWIDNEKKAQQVSESQPEGSRKRGRQRKKWERGDIERYRGIG